MIPLFLIAAGWADVVRWAILVGNNQGFSSSRTLYFAETDARKVGSVLEDLGGVPADHQRLLLGRNRFDVLMAMGSLKEQIAAAKSQGNQTVLYFYYSGHADQQQLQLGRTWIGWTEVQEMLDRSGADVRVAFVDACQSGSMIRAKGGTLAPSFVFDVSEQLGSNGSVLITSSADNEASQESNEVGGSYFTHFLVSALAGSADEDRDGRVTLSEAYRQVFHETVLRTAATRGGTQHPNYEWDLSGSGDIVITELQRAAGTLVLSGDHSGSFAVFDEDRRMFVAEVEVTGSDRRLSLRPGRYLVQKRYPTYLGVAELRLEANSPRRLEEGDFHALEYENDVAKGSIDATIRKVTAPRVALDTSLGVRAFATPIRDSWFPTSYNLSLGASWHWLGTPYFVAEASAGGGYGLLQLPGLSYQIPTALTTATLGAGLGVETPDALFGAGLGFHLEGLFLHRSFPGQSVDSQTLFTVAPGLMGHVGLYPGRTRVEFQARTHYLPYLLDDRDLGVGYHQFLLTVGYRL